MNSVDFKNLGLDEYVDEFLNWCLEYRDNLEWMKQKKTMELRSTQATLHFDDRGIIKLIEKRLNDKR